MLRRCLALTLTAVSVACALPARADGDAWRARHVLERLGYGPAPGAIAQVQAMGVPAYIQAQLHPETIPLPEALSEKLGRLRTVAADPDTLYHTYFARPKQKKEDPQAKARERVPLAEAAEARLLRATESPRQLEAAMTEFWFDHFNVYAGKGPVRVWVGAYEEQAIRPHVLGRFRDLLGAVAHHPAMIFYLDNWRNTAPGAAPERRGRHAKPKKRPAGGLNENYARELMELHTLGVDGGYSQADVVALARVLTGWGFVKPGPKGDWHFHFNERLHDDGAKVLLGQPLTAHGEAEVEQALDLLADHPATARHVSYELARFFVADEPPAALVERMATRWRETHGDLAAVMAACFDSPEFWDARVVGTKFKSPYRYVVSAMRATGAQPEKAQPVTVALRAFGMPLFGCLTPDGYPVTQSAWLSPQGMALRIGVATKLGSGKTAWAKLPARLDADALGTTLGWSPSASTAEAVQQARPALRPALVLGSPEFMRY